jgi:hypothetical protein
MQKKPRITRINANEKKSGVFLFVSIRAIRVFHFYARAGRPRHVGIAG